MSFEGYPIPSFNYTPMPYRALNGGSALPQTDPTKVTDAHGMVGPSGRVTIDVNGACTLTLFIWNPTLGVWRNPGSASSSYQKTFAGAGYDFFDATPEALFYVKASVGSIVGTAGCDPVNVGPQA